jgi:3-oxoacyl-[acyl-carrier protein] reductase
MATLIDLEGRVSLVTGSSRGIGRAIAETLAAAGSDVVINARTPSTALDELSQEIARTHGVRCEAIAADIGDIEQVNALFQQTFKSFRRLDTLVNNAGVMRDGVIGMIRQEDLAANLRINTVGTVNCIQAGARLLQRSGGGSIINLASIIGIRGNAGQLAYAASKGAIVSATLSAAKELAGRQIRVNAIAPGYIDTQMIRSFPEQVHRETLSSIGMGRIGTPADVASVALFLASPLSQYVTGAVIGVDGGMRI